MFLANICILNVEKLLEKLLQCKVQQCKVDELCVYYCATFNFFLGYIILKVNCMFYISTIIMLLDILLYTNKDY